MQRRTIERSVALAGALLVGACSSLKVERVDSSEDTVHEGVIYQLPAKHFAVKAVERLQNCSVNEAGDLMVTVAVKAEAQPITVADSTQKYRIDYGSIDSLVKENNLTISRTAKGMLTGVNATTVDHTGDTISQVVGAGFKIASLVAGVPLQNAAEPEKPVKLGPAQRRAKEKLWCGPVALEKLARVKELERKVAASKKKDEIAEFRAEITAIQDGPLSVTIEDTMRPQLVGIEAGAASEGRVLDLYPPSWVLDGWVTRAGRGVLATPKYGASENPDALGVFTVQFYLDPGDGRIARAPKAASKGIVYRVPADGNLMACRGSCSSGVKDKDNRYQPIRAGERLLNRFEPIPQYGLFASLPFDSKAFDSTTLQLTFDEPSGALLTTVYASKAEAEAATKAMNDALKQAGSYQKGLLDTRAGKVEADYNRLQKDEAAKNALLKELATRQKTLLEIEKAEQEYAD